MSEFDWNPFAGDRWKAEEVGDSIKGKVIGIRVEKSSYPGKDDYPVVTLQTDTDGTKVEVHCSTMLAGDLAKRKPQVGDWLGIKLVELKNTGKGSPLKLYDVAMKSAPRTPAEAGNDSAALISGSMTEVEDGRLETLAAEFEDTADLSEFSDEVL